jgi:RHS repeat-associated protein
VSGRRMRRILGAVGLAVTAIAAGQASFAQERRAPSPSRGDAHAGASALQVAQRHHGGLLGSSPTDAVTVQRVERFLTPSAALVDRGARPSSLLESRMPLATRGPDGALAPIDLTLRTTGADFRPANPLVDVSLPVEATGVARLSEVDVGVSLGRAADITAQRTGGHLFYAEALVDADLILAPRLAGFEAMVQLRSAASPERLRMPIDVPEGARLRELRGGPIEVQLGGRAVARVSAPKAWDAKGRPVKVRGALRGRALELRVAHRRRDVSYPVMVDPEFASYVEWRTDPSLDFNGWTYGETSDFDEAAITGQGLWVRARENVCDQPSGSSAESLSLQSSTSEIPHCPDRTWTRSPHWLGSAGMWLWVAPANTSIYRVDFLNATHHSIHTCVDEGFMVAGSPLSGSTQWQSGVWTSLSGGTGGATGTSPFQWCEYMPADSKTHCLLSSCQPDASRPERNQVAFGLRSTLDTSTSRAWQLGAEALLSGARIYVHDFNAPRIPAASVSHSPDITHWSDAASRSVTATAEDDGLGVKRIELRHPTATGTETVADTHPCRGDRTDRCPGSWQRTLSYGSGLPEGRHEVTLTAHDLVGNQGEHRFEVRSDRSPPAMDFRGSTLHQGGQTLTEPSYQLRIRATDGSRAAPAQERAGVKAVEVWVRPETNANERIAQGPHDNFVRKANVADPCTHPQGSCERNDTWTMNRAEYAPGEYTIRVVAKDQIAADATPGWEQPSHATYRDFSVFVPPPVEDRADDRIGLERWWTYETTDTGAGTAAHVNLSNGNLVWHSEPIINIGRGLSTHVNLTYNSQQRVQLPLLETPVEQLLEPYSEVGRGFSLGVSSLTRLNERLNVDLAAGGRITLTDPDGTRHLFRAESGQPDVFRPPPGVQLHLRRFSRSHGFIDAPVFGFEQLEEPRKAWAATRPDGVTHYFDQLGYQTSVEDRNGNVLTFVYEYRSPTRDACQALNQPTNLNVFSLPGKLCPKKVVRVTDPGGRHLDLTYYPRTLSSLPGELVPSGGIPPAARDAADPSLESSAYASGRVKSIVDHKQRVLELAYDPDGYLKNVTEAKGTSAERRRLFRYEPVQLPLKIKPLIEVSDPRSSGADNRALASDPLDPSTGVTRIEYEPRSTGDSLNELLAFDREVISVQDRGDSPTGPAGRKVLFDIDQTTGLTRVTDTRNHMTRYRLDARGRMTEMTDARSTVTTVQWDDATVNDNNPARIVEAAGTADEAVTDLAHNQNGLPTAHKDPEAQVDPGRGMTELTYANSDGHASHQSPRTTGNPPVSIDANRGFVSDLTTIKRPRGNTTTFSYDGEGRGNLRFRRDHEGHQAETQYGPNGVVTKEIDEVDKATTYADHGPDGLPRTVTDARGGVWRFCIDEVGNVTRATDPRGSAQHHCGSGRLPFSTERTFDALDRLTSEVVPKRSSTGSYITRSRAYDKNDNPTSFTDGNGQPTIHEYTPMDQLSVLRPPPAEHDEDGAGVASAVTRLEYDSEENLVKEITPKGTHTAAAGDFETDFRYDELGRQVAMIRRSSDSGEEPALATGFAYDRRGNLVGLADPKRTKAAPGEPEVDVLSETDRRFTFEYDRVDNRTAEVEDPGDLRLRTEYDYDPNDNLKSEADPRGKVTTYDYDGRDLLTDVTDPTGARTHFELRPNGQLASVTTPRGTASADPNDFKTVYGYNDNNELISRSIPKHPEQYGGLAREVLYERNAVGDPVRITDGRGNSFENKFLDSGELRWTERPSWWIYAPSAESGATVEAGPFRERPLDQPNDPDASELPRSEGHGDFGSVDPEALPELIPRAGATTFEYDDELRLKRVIDLTGDTSTLDYDQAGRLIKVKQPHQVDAGTSTYVRREFGYDRNDNQTEVVDPEGFKTDFLFDQYDRLIRREAPGGSANGGGIEDTDWEYDPNGNLTRMEPPREELEWLWQYDAVDRMTSSTNPAGDRTEFTYDRAGNRATEKTPRGHVWEMAYTDRNELAKVIAPQAGQDSQAGRETLFAYDRDGNQTLIDAPGAGNRVKTRMVYDGRGMLWKQTTGQSQDTIAAGGNNRTTITEYDANGNLRRVVNPAGVDEGTQVERRAWDGGALTTNSTAGENATVYRYSKDDLLTSIHLPFGDPDGGGPAGDDQTRWRQDLKRDPRGRIEWIDAPYAWAGTCNSDADNPAADPSCTARTSYTHFDSGWVKSQSEPQVVDPDGGAQGPLAVHYGYDLRGNQTRWATNPGAEERRIVTRSFFPNGTLRQRTAKEKGSDAAPQRTYAYQYNANHSLTRVEERLAGTPPEAPPDDKLDIERDAAERVIRVDPPAAQGKKNTEFAYDRDGNVIDRRVDGAGGTSGDTYSFRYDALGRETHMFFHNDWQQTADPARFAGQPDHTTTTTRWDSGALRSRTRPNGVVESRWFADDGDILRMRRSKGSTGAVLKDQQYVYDDNGNRTRDERGTHVFNARRQLVQWTRAQGPRAGSTVSYGLNGAGAILRREDGANGRVETYSYRGDRLYSVTASEPGKLDATARYRYDPDGFGNLVRVEQPGQDTVYDYDSFGRLTRADGPGTGDDVSYSYDPLDRRDLRTEGGKSWVHTYVGLSERVSREELTDGSSRRYQYDSQLVPVGRRATGPGVDNSLRSFALDANGSVEGLEDADGDIRDCTGSTDPGCRADGYLYDPYGQLESDEAGLTAEATDNQVRFEGFHYQPQSQTYDMRARPYRPDIARFLTPDRYQSASGDLALQADPLTNNRYAFAAANPVNNIEFDGHDPITTYNPRGRQQMKDKSGECFRDCNDRDFPGSEAPPSRTGSPGGSYESWSLEPQPSGDAPLTDTSSQRDHSYRKPPPARTSLRPHRSVMDRFRHRIAHGIRRAQGPADRSEPDWLANCDACQFGKGLLVGDDPNPFDVLLGAAPFGRLRTFGGAAKGAPRAGASALEDASQAAFNAAEGPINISRKHLPGAGGRYNKFAEGVDVDSVVRDALRSPNALFRPNPGGGYRIDTDLGRAIGQGGRRTVRTIVSDDGRVITAFPYGPKAP